MSTHALALPSVSPDGGLKRYLEQIRTFPVLSAEEEFMLAKRWREHGDVAAAHQLTTSHLRLVVKIAMGYRGYGLPVGDLIAEGNIGMMQAVKRFDPDKGFRLSTYAMWWIKAAIQEYILRSWSLVKMGTSAAQKRLFFNLKRLKSKLGVTEGELRPETAQAIAKTLDVSEHDVNEMNRRMIASDRPLNATVSHDGDETTWIDLLPDTAPTHDQVLEGSEERLLRHEQLEAAMAKLNPREQDIVRLRMLAEEPLTLEDLSQKYKVSRERIRQIESAAFKKLQKEMRPEDA